MKRLNIRWRLTAWYGAVLMVVLAAFSIAVYFIMETALVAHLDGALAEELSEMAREANHASTWAGLEQELHRQFSSHEGYEFQVASVNRAVLFRSRGLTGASLTPPAVSDSSSRQSVVLGGLGEWRVQSRRVEGPAGSLVIQAAGTMAPVRAHMRSLLMVFVVAVPLALAGALAGGYALARRALAPVDRIRAAAQEISAAHLDRRLDVPPTDDELGRLARTLNGMIDRLARSFRDIQRFTGDAAHELRTPLSVIRTEVEVALRAPRTNEQYRDVLATVLEETDRLTELTDQLLYLCRLDAGRALQRREPISVATVLEDVMNALRPKAEKMGVTLETRCCDAGFVLGDGAQLRRLLMNLVDNAVKYTPRGGRIAGRVDRHGDRIETVIEDTGIGIPAEHLPHVCERFYRADPARNQTIEGTGLGLAICQAIADAHAATLTIESEFARGTKCTFSASCVDVERSLAELRTAVSDSCLTHPAFAEAIKSS
jgi:heavy metal sensor kinase